MEKVHYDKKYFHVKFQDGPVKVKGKNGCQTEDVLEVLIERLTDLNKRLPCRENSLALTKLQEGMHWLKARTADRRKRGVEGTDAP